MRRKLVAGNWKMHGSRAQNEGLLATVSAEAARLESVEVAVCVPFPYLFQAQTALAGTRVAWGAQNVSQHEQGAYTGEVSALMLTDFGCRYVIVGHSERRSLYGETDAVVAAKCKVALVHRLIPIVCVGETLSEREAGVTEQVVARQVDAVMDAIGVGGLGQCVLAYEPVWAIGTGRTATPDQAQAVHRFLRCRVAEQDPAVAQELRVLYGGSVKGNNAAELFAMPDIDGGLIGGASLVGSEFVQICRAAAN